jgi:hypothetical protein
MPPSKATEADFLGRFREIVSDSLNLLIERVPTAGIVEGNEVVLHSGNRVPISGDADVGWPRPGEMRPGRPKLDQKCFPAEDWKHLPTTHVIETSLLP